MPRICVTVCATQPSESMFTPITHCTFSPGFPSLPKVNTVGKEGKTGEKVQCVIGVNMLSEGWDAQTVTHILGIRAFTSQLLCEQVVGRGLRRISYDNLSEPEYVTVFGVPFTYLPVEEKPGPPRPPVAKTKIEPIQERKTLE